MVSHNVDWSPDEIIRMANRIKIEREISKLKFGSEKLKIRMEIEGLDTSEKISEMDNKIGELERKLKENSEPNLLMNDIIQKQDKLLENIERLEEKRNSISKEVYIALKREYLEGIEKLSEQIASIQFYLTKLLKEKKEELKELKLGLEKLGLRKEIEEIPEEIFQQKNEKIKKELKETERLEEAIEYLLTVVERS